MSRIKEIILALAIVVVLNLFFNYGVFTFYDSPDYEKFCPVELTQKLYADKSECEAVGGRWFEGTGEVKYHPSEPRPVPVEPAAGQKGWCDATAECRDAYESVRDVYNRNVFVILVVLGLISLGLGFLVINAAPVANGFLGGGLLSLIIGTVRYWSDMNDYLRFIILGLALAGLIWLGYKKIATRD
ncbi:MAG: hypothetical protein WAP55_00715 [Minisyncoccia bacterium]